MQRRRPLPPPGRPAPGAAGPELHRARALPHRRRRRVRVRDGQAGRLSVGQPPQRVAARAHPLLGVRARVRAAAGDADVLPGRPAVLPGPDLQLGARRRGARAARRRVRPRPHASPSGRSPTAGTSSWPGPRSRMPDADAAPDRRPVLLDRPAVARRAGRRRAGRRRARSRCAAPSTTARARRCPTRCRDLAGARAPACRGFGRCPTDERRPLGDRHAQAGGGRRRGAARRRRRVRARAAATASPTRIYFGDEPEANAADPLLVRRSTPSGVRRWSPPPRTAATASTSTSRETVRPSSSRL